MYQEDFTKVDPQTMAEMLEHINPVFSSQAYDIAKASIMETDLSFYHGYKLVEVSDRSIHPVRKHYVIYNEIDGETHILDFTNVCIYGLNKTLPIMLDGLNVKDYVRFFFNYVIGQHGRFIIVDEPADIILRDKPHEKVTDVIAQMIEPLTMQDVTEDGVYVLTGCFVFKTDLFKTTMTVTADGFIRMQDEELIIQDMPIIDDVIER